MGTGKPPAFAIPGICNFLSQQKLDEPHARATPSKIHIEGDQRQHALAYESRGGSADHGDSVPSASFDQRRVFDDVALSSRLYKGAGRAGGRNSQQWGCSGGQASIITQLLSVETVFNHLEQEEHGAGPSAVLTAVDQAVKDQTQRTCLCANSEEMVIRQPIESETIRTIIHSSAHPVTAGLRRRQF